MNFSNTFQTRFENEGVKRNYDAHWYDVNDEIEGSDVICCQKQWKTTHISLVVCQPAPSEQRQAGKDC